MIQKDKTGVKLLILCRSNNSKRKVRGKLDHVGVWRKRESSPPYSLASTSTSLPVHTAPKSGTKPIRYDSPLWRSERCSFASLQKSHRNHRSRLCVTHNAPINVMPAGGGGEAGHRVGI